MYVCLKSPIILPSSGSLDSLKYILSIYKVRPLGTRVNKKDKSLPSWSSHYGEETDCEQVSSASHSDREEKTCMAWPVATFPASLPAGSHLPLDAIRIWKCLQFLPQIHCSTPPSFHSCCSLARKISLLLLSSPSRLKSRITFCLTHIAMVSLLPYPRISTSRALSTLRLPHYRTEVSHSHPTSAIRLQSTRN